MRIGGFHVNKFCLVLLVLVFGFGISFSGCGTTDISDVVGTDYFNLSGVVLDNNDEGIEGVTIKITGDFGSKETETDEDGAWEKEDLEGVVTVTPEKDGFIFLPDKKIVDEESLILFDAAVLLVIDETPNKDTYISHFDPDDNYSKSSSLYLKVFEDFPRMITLLGFNELESIPESATILEAYIELFVMETLNAPFDISLGYITSPWVENEVTWNNPPSLTILEGANYKVEENLEGSMWKIPITEELQAILNKLRIDKPSLHGLFFEVNNYMYKKVEFASSIHKFHPIPKLYVEYVPYKIDL